jgi:hypothetical protein
MAFMGSPLPRGGDVGAGIMNQSAAIRITRTSRIRTDVFFNSADVFIVRDGVVV